MSIRQSPQPTERAQAARSANAQQATGPATPEGKARSKMNALKDGDYARDFRQAIKLQGDDVGAFDGLYHALLDHYQPEPPETAFPGSRPGETALAASARGAAPMPDSEHPPRLGGNVLPRPGRRGERPGLPPAPLPRHGTSLRRGHSRPLPHGDRDPRQVRRSRAAPRLPALPLVRGKLQRVSGAALRHHRLPARAHGAGAASDRAHASLPGRPGMPRAGVAAP